MKELYLAGKIAELLAAFEGMKGVEEVVAGRAKASGELEVKCVSCPLMIPHIGKKYQPRFMGARTFIFGKFARLSAKRACFSADFRYNKDRLYYEKECVTWRS